MKVIINADDCGYSSHVNEAIEAAIVAGKITSTTMMANMGDPVEGGVELYKKYHGRVSFGCHMNLTEGSPMLKSDELLEKGFYKEVDGKVVFNGKQFFHKPLSRAMRSNIKKELSAQIELLLDNGVKLSHLDSHHHIHTSVTLMGVVADLVKKYHIKKMRRMYNFVPTSLSFYARQLLALSERVMVGGLMMTDYFCSYSDYMKKPTLKRNIGVIELECHPGGNFPDEERMMNEAEYPKEWELITYNEL